MPPNLAGFIMFLSFFFQAEDGIRDPLVTGVQTCALPICVDRPVVPAARSTRPQIQASRLDPDGLQRPTVRSEERRVGKECRCRGPTNLQKIKLIILDLNV